MCEFLDQVEARGEARGLADGMARGMARGLADGMARGEARGEENLAALMTSLFHSGRNEDAVRAAADREYRLKLFKEFGIH